MSRGALVDMLRDAARTAMPRHQAIKFEQVLRAIEKPPRRQKLLATPHLPPITIGRRFRPSRAKPRSFAAPPQSPAQLVLL